MTFQDMYLRSRNSALYHMLYNMQRRGQAVGPCTGSSADQQPDDPQPQPTPPKPEPDVEASTQKELKDALSDPSKSEVLIEVEQPLSISGSPIVVPEGKVATIDLNGNSISTTGLDDQNTSDTVVAVRRGGTLILEDTSPDASGVVDGAQAPSIYNALKLTERGEPADGDPAKIVVESGTYKGTYYGISGNGGRQNTDVTINGGKFEGATPDDSVAVYQPQNGKLVINGGEFIASTCVVQKSGQAIINGGTFTGNGIAQPFVHNKNGWNNTGDCFVVESCNYPGSTPIVEINGGTFTSENGKPVASYAQAGYSRITKFVKGGTFNKELDADLVADGYVQVADGQMFKVVKA